MARQLDRMNTARREEHRMRAESFLAALG